VAGHISTIGRAGALLIVTVLVASRPVRAQEGPDASPTRRAADPVDLAAHRVQAWNSGDEQWVVLSGEAAVLQEGEGLRADQAVVRITPVSAGGSTSYRLEVYAEGEVRPTGKLGAPRRSMRATFSTEKEVRLKPYDPKGLSRPSRPPRSLGVLARGFPRLEPASEDGPVAEEPKTAATPASPDPVDPEVSATPLPPLIEAEASRQPVPEVVNTQFEQEGFDENPFPLSPEPEAPEVDLPPIDVAPPVAPGITGEAGGEGEGPPSSLLPLPAPDTGPAPPREAAPTPAAPPTAPILPGTQRRTSILPRSGGPGFTFETQPTTPDGTSIAVIRGGVNIVIHSPPPLGTVDVSADSAIIWRKADPEKGAKGIGPDGELVESSRQPMEIYLEGHVVFRQDERVAAGNGDQKTYRAERVFFNVQSDRLVAINAELDMFAPGLVAPVNMKSPRIEQYRPLERAADGKLAYGFADIHADKTVLSGSRFPNPGYRFTSRSVDVRRVVSDQADPNTGRTVGKPDDPRSPQDLTWRIDARQNFFYLGAVPIFYWPRFLANADDLDPPIQQIVFRSNNYFGQQVLADFNAFKLFGISKPQWIDTWNLDIDYLSERGVAVGTEVGWFGKDLFRDLSDPYHRNKKAPRTVTGQYFGYLDIWGLKDEGIDVLGSGPAVITDPASAGKEGFQRSSVPPFQDFRGRFNMRHMQSFLTDDADLYEDFRLQVEFAYTSDRQFLEEYYKRLFDVGLDQETLAYLIRQRENTAWTVMAEANLQDWYTDSQWLPKLDYYRLGDSFLGNRLTHYQHSGVNYANTHTASEVNNPNVFANIPYDPISNTSGTLKTGRAFTSHEIDLPIQLDVLRVVPYAQGQAIGWNDQIGGEPLGRLWGAVGARADVMAWKAYRGVESELLNVHGLNHKINFQADYRTAFSTVDLDRIGVQDDLDDNTYEQVRRYFAMTTYAGGILPSQYDPRFLINRRAVSPITGTTDVQSTIETLQLGIHQRLQTKRGPEGRRRIIDFMTLDLTTTYFPHADRDNFGKPFGQNMYNWEWFIGDRTSIISYGWFEFFELTGDPLTKPAIDVDRRNNPFGLNIITTGISISRPPRTNLFIGYTVIDTGVITTSALNSSVSYWLSPKWYGTYATSYDFGYAQLLAANFSVTRIGADYLMSVGLSIDPQRESYMFAVELQPRISPNIRFGSTAGMNNFDSRYAPTQ